MANRVLFIGALLALIGVAAGAFGAHGLRPILSEKMMTVFETGVRYHLVHALAMLIAGLSAHWFSHRVFAWAGWSFFYWHSYFFWQSLHLSPLRHSWPGHPDALWRIGISHRMEFPCLGILEATSHS